MRASHVIEEPLARKACAWVLNISRFAFAPLRTAKPRIELARDTVEDTVAPHGHEWPQEACSAPKSQGLEYLGSGNRPVVEQGQIRFDQKVGKSTACYRIAHDHIVAETSASGFEQTAGTLDVDTRLHGLRVEGDRGDGRFKGEGTAGRKFLTSDVIDQA